LLSARQRPKVTNQVCSRPGEDDAAARRDLELREAVVGRLEVDRHAALHLAVLLHAAPERHALQVALQRVVPLVVRAGEVLAVAVALAAKAHAAVRADVLDDVDLAILRAHQDHRALADDGALEIAGVRNLGLEADVAPMTLVEEAFELTPMQLLAGVGGERDAAGARARPGERRRLCCGIHGGALSAGASRRASARMTSGLTARPRPRMRRPDQDIVGSGFRIANIAPCGSTNIARRPTWGMSLGGTIALAPSDLACSVVLSQSATQT
jgi:hypothetical protein